MNSFDNSKEIERSNWLEQSFQSAINNGAAINVYEQAKVFRNAASANDKPRLVEARTSLETETLWQKRLFMLLEAENKLLKVINISQLYILFLYEGTSDSN